MKFGHNLIALRKHIHVWDGTHNAYGSTLKFSKCFKISHTHILDSREHAPKVLAHLEQVDFDPYAYGCNTYAYVSKLEIWVYGWVFGLEIDKL